MLPHVWVPLSLQILPFCTGHTSHKRVSGNRPSSKVFPDAAPIPPESKETELQQQRVEQGLPVANCAVIFAHGYLGSRFAARLHSYCCPTFKPLQLNHAERSLFCVNSKRIGALLEDLDDYMKHVNEHIWNKLKTPKQSAQHVLKSSRYLNSIVSSQFNLPIFGPLDRCFRTCSTSASPWRGVASWRPRWTSPRACRGKCPEASQDRRSWRSQPVGKMNSLMNDLMRKKHGLNANIL